MKNHKYIIVYHYKPLPVCLCKVRNYEKCYKLKSFKVLLWFPFREQKKLSATTVR